MINGADNLARTLEGTVLEGLPVEEVARGCLRVLGVESSDILPAWQAARDVLPVTGRQPVFQTNDFGMLDVLLDEFDAPDPPQESRLAELDSGARSIDPWTAFGAWSDLPVEDSELHLWVPTLDGVDLLGEARAGLPSLTRWGIDRWVYDRVRTDPRLFEQVEETVVRLDAGEYWFEPDSAELWFLPTASPHQIAAYVSYYPIMGREEILSAAMWQWDHKWGAGLVAAWDTMLQFSATRRPTPGAEAWELARQLKNFATHVEVSGWTIALQLTRSSEWFLHSRP